MTTLALACIGTALVGLFLGAAWTWWLVRTPQTVLDDLDCGEYRDAAIIAWSNATWAEFDRAAS